MINNTVISVIVPIYNVENYINRCLNSIINQTYKNLQIILVDDGSTDDSGKVCDKYALKDSRIKVIHQKNSGPVRARKTGLEASTGEYIGFVDSDDWIEPNMYEEMLNNLIQTNADFAQSRIILEKNGITSINYNYDEEVVDLPKNILNIWKALMGLTDNSIDRGFVTKLFKKDFIKDCIRHLPDDMYLGEDYTMTVISFLKCNRVSFLKKAYYHYVIRNNSLTRVYGTPKMFQIAKMHNQLESIFKKFNYYEQMKPYIEKAFIKDMSRAIKSSNICDIIVYMLRFTNELINKKIVIYGAGLIGRDYYLQLMSNSCCQVVNWVDKNFDKYNYKDCTVNPVSSLKDTNYDIILIAVKKQSTADQIKDELIEMGIDKDKLYWSEPNSLI